MSMVLFKLYNCIEKDRSTFISPSYNTCFRFVYISEVSCLSVQSLESHDTDTWCIGAMVHVGPIGKYFKPDKKSLH